MRMLLIGDYRKNAGPSNVNKSLINNSDNELLYIKAKSKFVMIFEILFKAALSDVLIVSGCGSKKYYTLLKPFHKPMIYILHGYAKYENVVNNLHLSEDAIKAENSFLERSDLIVPVSKWYSEWFSQQCPQWKNKIQYLNNGVNIDFRPLQIKDEYTIAVTGGTRIIKNNIEVCRAVEKLYQKNNRYHVYVFGHIYKNNDCEIMNFPFVTFMGQLNKDEYYHKLDRISCFILDSEVEPFGLVVADAINCNCSLLLSKSVGANSILTLTDMDIIENPHNIEELCSKIENVFENPNSERVARSINIEEVSERSAYLKLKEMCRELIMR